MDIPPPTDPQEIRLEPMDLHNPLEFDELQRQRVLCGWNSSRAAIEVWREAMDAQTRKMFWIIPATNSHLAAPQRYGGHIGLLSVTNPPDIECALLDKTVLHITSLFILPQHRRGGTGKAAMQAMEAMAQVEPHGSPGCKAVTIHTMSRRYTEDDGEEWRGMYAKRGMEPPVKGSSNEDWYTRMGYVKWKEQPMYPDRLLDGTEILLTAVYMRKELG